MNRVATKFRSRRGQQKAVEEPMKALEESAGLVETPSPQLQCSPSTLRVRLNEAIAREKSLQQKILNFQSTGLGAVSNPGQTSAAFSYPITLVDGARREQDGCSYPDLNQEPGNMTNSITISSPPSVPTSASALINSHVGNVPQPDLMPEPSRGGGVSHPENQIRKRPSINEDDKCDRTHHPNKRRKNRSASEPRPAGPTLRGTAFTVSDVEPASSKKPNSYGTREKSALVDIDEVGHPPVTAKSSISLSSPRTLNPPASIVPLESWEDSTSVAHTTDVTIAAGSFIPLRVKILHPMPSLPACGRPTRTSPTVPLLPIASQPASPNIGDPQQQIPASFSELDGTREKSQMEQGSVEEKPPDVNQVTVGGENEAVGGSLDIPSISNVIHMERSAQDTPSSNQAIVRSLSTSRSQNPKVDAVSPASSWQSSTHSDGGGEALQSIMADEMSGELLRNTQDSSSSLVTHQHEDVASDTNEPFMNDDQTHDEPAASSLSISPGHPAGIASSAEPPSGCPHPSTHGGIRSSDSGHCDQPLYRLSDDNTPAVTSPTHSTVSRLDVSTMPRCKADDCREAKILAAFLNWLSSADPRREEELNGLGSKIHRLESQLASYQRENTQLKALITDRSTKAHTDSSIQHMQTEQFTRVVSADDFRVDASSPENFSNEAGQSAGIQQDTHDRGHSAIPSRSSPISPDEARNTTFETRSSLPSEYRPTALPTSQSQAGSLPQKRKYRPTGKSNTSGQTNVLPSASIVAGPSPSLHLGTSGLSSLASDKHCLIEVAQAGSDSPCVHNKPVVEQSSRGLTSSAFAKNDLGAAKLANMAPDHSLCESSPTGEEDLLLLDKQLNRRSRVPGFLVALQLLEAEADKWLEGQASRHSLL